MAAIKALQFNGVTYSIGGQEEIESLRCDIASTNTTLSSSFDELKCRVDILEQQFSDLYATIYELQNLLRPVPDVTTENPNQKGDLEIFSQIEVNPFLPNFIDLDSEEFLQQRPLWDFTVDF